ncbi:DUF3179 domain-containing (seleno)protein [Roseovarius phycicola]|uniref:DUF3179 domain-containing (Seleno)protein n=1 Tax=Roseovarius phycicola TaxID=3080976 RepID=A0ABZ2HPQ3_9RHOB
MIWEATFWFGLALSLVAGFFYFRELGDISQMFFRIKRNNLVWVIRHEYKIMGAGLAGVLACTLSYWLAGAGTGLIWWPALIIWGLFYLFPYVWLHTGMRTKTGNAKYYSLKEARQFVSPSNEVLVIVNNGIARAHPDAELLRPHVVGNSDGFDGADIQMTYCGMSNLGLAFEPSINGQPVKLEVMAQIANNLILRDNNTGEPVQQILGARECEIVQGTGMTPWPTFRMTFRGFEKAYPDGTVYINQPSSNPLLKILDTAQDMMFTWGIRAQHRIEAPLIDNMTRSDSRLPNKTYIWGVNIGTDATCYTDEFVKHHEGPINTSVGGRGIVVAYDENFESLGVWYNDRGGPVSEIDFYGKSDQGQLARVETLKPGMFWHVWAEYFPHTDINRTDREPARRAG